MPGFSRAKFIPAIRHRDGDKCWVCGRVCDFNKLARRKNLPNAATVDHVIPRVNGGRDHMSNLKIACRECNMNREFTK